MLLPSLSFSILCMRGVLVMDPAMLPDTLTKRLFSIPCSAVTSNISITHRGLPRPQSLILKLSLSQPTTSLFFTVGDRH